jgi:hypothetical protein
MNTHPYLWFALFVLAMAGIALALNQDMKPSTRSTNLYWGKWFIVFALLALFDAAMLVHSS